MKDTNRMLIWGAGILALAVISYAYSSANPKKSESMSVIPTGGSSRRNGKGNQKRKTRRYK